MSPKIHSRLWKDEDFWQLDAAGKVAFLWLLTNGETNNCGHLLLSPRQFTSDTGLDPKGVVELGKTLPRAFVRDGNHLWLRNFMRHQWSPGERGPNSKMWKGLINAITAMPETLRAECLREYPEFYAGVAAITAPWKPLASPLEAPSHPPSPLQAPCKGPEQSRAEQSRALSSSSSEGGPGETLPPTELPPGFPATLAQASAQATLAGVPARVLEEVWNAAMSRGGLDHSGKPIRSWVHHLRAESLKPWRLEKPGGKNAPPQLTPALAALPEMRTL